MSKIAPFISRRVAPGSDLTRPDLLELAGSIGTDESLWREHVDHDANERQYRQLYRDPNIDVWLICWMFRQDTGYLDHDRSSGAVYVCEGVLCEDHFHRDEDGWIREKTRRHAAGESFDFDAAYIHGVRNETEVPATSIHVYSPAL